MPYRINYIYGKLRQKGIYFIHQDRHFQRLSSTESVVSNKSLTQLVAKNGDGGRERTDYKYDMLLLKSLGHSANMEISLGIPKYDDDGISAKEHFTDESVFVNWLCLFLAFPGLWHLKR